MGFIVFILIIISGIFVFPLIGKKINVLNQIPYYFIFGSAVSIPLIYLFTSYVLHNLSLVLLIYSVAVIVLAIVRFNKIKPLFSKNAIFFVLLSSTFFLLLKRTFEYRDNAFYIASNLYLDMGVHIPVIKSFSQSQNFPFELPLFGGKGLIYHFFYDFFTGVLEFLGLRIDIGYNIIVAFLFASLLLICIDVGSFVFKKRSIGLLAFVLFIFPSDLSFIGFIKNHPNLLFDFWHNNTYSINSFLGDRTMGGFLYINTYLNQRHLLFALVLSLAIFIPLWEFVTSHTKRKFSVIITLCILISLIPLWNMPVFLIMSFLTILLLVIFKTEKKYIIVLLLVIACISAPQLLLISTASTNHINFSPGYLVYKNLSLSNIALLWLFNIGVGILTIIGGFIIGTKNQKKLFIALLPIFVFPNVFQVAREMFDNHKFFNFWFLFMCFFSASFIFFLWKKNKYSKLVAIVLVVLMIISGLINLMVVKNDVQAQISDYTTTPFINKVEGLVPSNETVITNGEIFDPLSLVGRKTYLGRINYIYAFGGDPQKRISIQQELLGNEKKGNIISVVKKEGVRYIIIYKETSIKNLNPVKREVLDNKFKKVYEDNFGIIYKI